MGKRSNTNNKLTTKSNSKVNNTTQFRIDQMIRILEAKLLEKDQIMHILHRGKYEFYNGNIILEQKIGNTKNI